PRIVGEGGWVESDGGHVVVTRDLGGVIRGKRPAASGRWLATVRSRGVPDLKVLEPGTMKEPNDPAQKNNDDRETCDPIDCGGRGAIILAPDEISAGDFNKERRDPAKENKHCFEYSQHVFYYWASGSSMRDSWRTTTTMPEGVRW